MWRPTSETPPPRHPCALMYDTAGRDVDMSEALTIGWHDGKRWHDVHGAAADPDAWLIGWLPLPVAETKP